MTERLFRYDPAELRSVAARLIAELGGAGAAIAQASDPDVWTELVLDWLAGVAADRARIDAAPARPHLTSELYAQIAWAPPRSVVRQGPLAMSHLSHPSFSEAHPYGYAYWTRAFEVERLETLLAVACEWGGGGRPGARFGRVMLAASDLASVDARAKAIVFASDDEAEHRRISDALGRLRLASWDARPWLWVDVPWRSDWQEHGPASGVLEG
jgi:hypothetical protein